MVVRVDGGTMTISQSVLWQANALAAVYALESWTSAGRIENICPAQAIYHWRERYQKLLGETKNLGTPLHRRGLQLFATKSVGFVYHEDVQSARNTIQNTQIDCAENRYTSTVTRRYKKRMYLIECESKHMFQNASDKPCLGFWCLGTCKIIKILDMQEDGSLEERISTLCVLLKYWKGHNIFDQGLEWSNKHFDRFRQDFCSKIMR